MCFITTIAKTNTYQKNAVHKNTELNGNRNFVNVALIVVAEVFDWRENESEELAEAEPWMNLREQRAGQRLCSTVSASPAARARGGDCADWLRRGRWAWWGTLTVWLQAWGHSKGEDKDIFMTLDRLQQPWDARAKTPPAWWLYGGTSMSCRYSASLSLPASRNLSPASLPAQLRRLFFSEYNKHLLQQHQSCNSLTTPTRWGCCRTGGKAEDFLTE